MTRRLGIEGGCRIGQFLLSFAIALGSNIGLSLVLERSGAGGLPALMILHAILLAATTLLVARYALGAIARWLSVTLVVCGLCVALAAAAGSASWSADALYLTTHVFADLATALFWALANQLFDMRAAKRAFPKIAAAGTAGGAIAGFVTPAMTSAGGVRGLTAMLLVAIALASGWSFWMARVPRARPAEPAPRDARVARRKPAPEDSRLVRAIVIGVVVVGAVTLFGRFLYARALEQAYEGDAATIAAQNGLLSGAASVLTTLTQLLVTPALMARWGVRSTLIVFPVVMTAVFSGIVARFGLVTGVLAHFATTVVRKGMYASADGVLPTALSAEQASRAVLLVTALGTPAGMVLSGAALRLGRAWQPSSIALLGLGLAVVLLVLTLWRTRSYTDALRLRLRKGGSELRLRLAGELSSVHDLETALTRELDPSDPGLLGNLQTLVRAQQESEKSGRVARASIRVQASLNRIVEHRLAEAYRLRAALEALPRAGGPSGLDDLWRRAIRGHVQSDLQMVLLALRASTGEKDLDRIAPRLFDIDPRARGAAVEILEDLCPPDLRPLMVPLVEEVGLEEAYRAASRRFGPPANDPMLALLDVPSDWLRAITVYAAAAVGPERYRARIEALSGSGDPWLRLACSRAMGRVCKVADRPEAARRDGQQ